MMLGSTTNRSFRLVRWLSTAQPRTQPSPVENFGHTSLPKHLGFHDTVNVISTVARKRTRVLTTKSLYEFSAGATSEQLLKSAQFLHRELPIRLAQRLLDYHALPFMTGCNPHLRQVYELYSEAYITLASQPRLLTSESQSEFTNALSRFIDDNMNVITMLARGVKEVKRVSSDTSSLTGFLDRTITSRIGIRLLIENQIALDNQARKGGDSKYVGVICRELRPTTIIRKMEEITQRMCRNRYGIAPSISLNGDTDAVFSYIPAHLEYILQELLKNAFRATTERHKHTGTVPDVDITVCKNETSLILRISDQGGGISPDMLDKCWDWSFTTVDEDAPSAGDGMLGVLSDSEPDGPLAGLGFGLPMTRAYTQYFGGSLLVVPMWGYGTDVHLTLKNLHPESAGASRLA